MKYAFKKLRRFRVYDLATGKHKATFSDLQSARFTGNSDVVYAEGADGARLAAFDQNKVSSLEATNGVVDLDMLALQVGTEVEEKTNGTGVMIREFHTVTAAEVTAKSFSLKHTASGTAGNEIGYIYKCNEDDTLGESLEQASAAAEGKFAYAAKAITVDASDAGKGKFLAEGARIAIDYYPTFSTYQLITSDNDKFAITGKIIVDAWFTDLCDNTDVPMQVIMPKGKVSGSYELAPGDSAATHGITVEAMNTSCGDEKNQWQLIAYDEADITG